MFEQMREQVRGRALRDAAELLAWRGYDNVRASELAKVTRLSVGSLYRQYGSKRGFAMAVLQFTEDFLRHHAGYEFSAARIEPDPGFRHAFLVFWRELARFALCQPALFCFTFLHWHPEDLEAPSSPTRELVREVLSTGEREGALAPGSTRVGESLVWGALAELARTAALGTEEVFEEDVVEAGEALWRALAPREDSGPRGRGGLPPDDVERQAMAPSGSGGASATGLRDVPLTGPFPAGQVESQAPMAHGSTMALAPEHTRALVAGSIPAGELVALRARVGSILRSGRRRWLCSKGTSARPFQCVGTCPGRPRQLHTASATAPPNPLARPAWHLPRHCWRPPGHTGSARVGNGAGPFTSRADLTRADGPHYGVSRGPRGGTRGALPFARHLSGALCFHVPPAVRVRSSWRGSHMHRRRWMSMVVSLVAMNAWAQAPEPEAVPAPEAAQAAELEEAVLPPLPELHPRTGEVVLGDGLAKMNVPESFGYLSPEEAQKVLVDVWGNPPGAKTLGMLVPSGVSVDADESWGVVIQYDDDGHVDDEDAADIDYADLLKEMQEGTKQANAERAKAGYGTVDLVGWAAQPRYDPGTRKLYWAKELAFSGSPEHTLNYNVRVLGKEGVLVLNAVSSMGALPKVEKDMQQVLAFTNFQPGHRYEDFDPATGRVAAYGVGGLVAGKVAAKAGLFKGLLAVLLGAKKLVIGGAVLLIAALGRLFKRGGNGEGGTP